MKWISRWLRRLLDFSVPLFAGAAIALVWANVSPDGYQRFVNWSAPGLSSSVTIESLVNDVAMALFFGLAAKEVWEALLPGGALASVRKAAMPLLAAMGGMTAPALIYVAGCWTLRRPDLLRGWAVPCATDIAFSYLIARLIFGESHPAIPFLLLLAIADDAGGLAILAIAYPQKPIAPLWFALVGTAILVGYLLRRLRRQSFWWYLLIPGGLSWIAFHEAGIHPALALVPIIPTLPHAQSDLGTYAREEMDRRDTLSSFEHFWSGPVELILGFFALVNSGVPVGTIGAGTWLVLLGLVVGKPMGIVLSTWVGERLLKLERPAGINYSQVLVVGLISAIGFTVALFVATAAFPVAGSLQDQVKMGAVGSILAGGIAYATARMLRIRALRQEGV